MAGLRLTILAAALLAPGAARAGETACWFDAGVLVVPAEVAGIAGDWILDTGSPQTLIDETRAQGAGFEAKDVPGAFRLAGMSGQVQAAVKPLDVRTWNLPTPAAGVIGADLLKAYVLDVSFAPCRVRLSEPSKAPRMPGKALPLAWDGGAPVAEAQVSDGAVRLKGPFVIATGANAPLRLASDLADAPGAPKPAELGPDGVWLARLAELEFGGQRLDDLGAGLTPPTGETAGVIGGPALAHYRLRFDFPRSQLTVR